MKWSFRLHTLPYENSFWFPSLWNKREGDHVEMLMAWSNQRLHAARFGVQTDEWKNIGAAATSSLHTTLSLKSPLERMRCMAGRTSRSSFTYVAATTKEVSRPSLKQVMSSYHPAQQLESSRSSTSSKLWSFMMKKKTQQPR
ncbi:hypothetical protein VIGAN_10084100 [Vigna angularis var. angularis]|uniref:Uncharacterized protein n=1 Tax=Vigna angularis var. angularis TaxID=157739 RepID=A0A0S3T3H3_PHAAN|nr:hypothetical protein VIGAN_10084100 [Vigna angularis var. angularis]